MQDFLVGRGEEKLASPAGMLVGRGWPGVGALFILPGLEPRVTKPQEQERKAYIGTVPLRLRTR